MQEVFVELQIACIAMSGKDLPGSLRLAFPHKCHVEVEKTFLCQGAVSDAAFFLCTDFVNEALQLGVLKWCIKTFHLREVRDAWE